MGGAAFKFDDDDDQPTGFSYGASVLTLDAGVRRDTGTISVEVEFQDLREIRFTSGPRADTDGLSLTLVVRSRDDEAMWRYFMANQEEFGRLMGEEVSKVCGKDIEIAEIHYKRGSLILTIIFTIKAFAIAHKGFFAVLGYLAGLYLPLKQMAADTSKWLPRLRDFIQSFFRGGDGPKFIPA